MNRSTWSGVRFPAREARRITGFQPSMAAIGLRMSYKLTPFQVHVTVQPAAPTTPGSFTATAQSTSSIALATSATAETDASILGVLLNAPTSGAVARVVTHGPAPLVAGAAGWTAADGVEPTTAGAGVVASAAAYTVGLALETATSGQTKMVFVRPGIVKA